MVAIDRDRPEAREAPYLGESLLSVASIFGPNASGKSNIIASFAWLRDAVQNSLRFWDEEIPIEQFAFAGAENRPTHFALELLIGGVRFEYVLELGPQAVLYEALFHYPEKKRRRIFEREGADLKFQRGLGNLSGTRDLLTGRTLALSIARRFDEPLVSDFSRDFLRTQSMGLTVRRGRTIGGGLRTTFPLSTRPTARWFEDSISDQPTLFDSDEVEESRAADRVQALALLQLADLGIDDVIIDEQEVAYPDSVDSGRIRTQRRIRLVHRTGPDRVPLDFSVESEGTRTWFQLIGPVLTALRFGSLLLFDELDGSLHPTLSAQLIRLFHDRATNPLGAQLVFTSHDTSLLNELNRDEVWLTEKGEDGATRLGALSDFAGERVRKSQNLENAYLHGRFGALPEVDRTDLLRALGLIG